MNPDDAPTLDALAPKLDRVFELAVRKVVELDASWDPARGAPVFTVEGRYTTRGWTEWTQGFQYGCALLCYDATNDRRLLDLGRDRTLHRMTPHVTHIGVHDHGFNNISTYGVLRRLAREGRFDASPWEMHFYELALKVSGAVQAARWSTIHDLAGPPNNRDGGFVHSFNGPHSLFSDTIRSMRSLALAWQLGHVLMGEADQPINLLHRAIMHCMTTARFNVYYGEGRDAYDTPGEAGRVVHESIFSMTDGRYRCPSTQQGYSPFTTWTRGMAWVLLGFAEQLQFMDAINDADVSRADMKIEREQVCRVYRRAAVATANWYIAQSFADGMVYWDSGAPGTAKLTDDAHGTSDPYNDHEPIDSSAAAIAGQGFMRLADYLASHGETEQARRYDAAARRIAATLFDEPYLSTDPSHQGLILHSVYHRPNGWDHVPPTRRIPCGESSMWGDYHALELALLLMRRADGKAPPTFFDGIGAA